MLACFEKLGGLSLAVPVALKRLPRFGPTKFMYRAEGVGKREADDVEIAALDAGNVAAGTALNGIGSGLVIGLLGGQVARNFIPAKRRKVHKRGLDKLAALNFRKAHQRNAGNNGMRTPREKFKHAPRIIRGPRFAENLPVEHHDRVRGDDDRWPDGPYPK